MKSTFVFLLPIILPGIGALFEDIRVEPIFIPEGICQKPKENDYVTLSYTWKLDDVNERLALQLHMGNSKYPGLEEIVKDMCKLQKNIVKIPAQVRLQGANKITARYVTSESWTVILLSPCIIL